MTRYLRRAVVGGLAAALVLLTALTALPDRAAATDTGPDPEWVLVMVEQHGCVYCTRWNAEVGPEYPITPEGRFAPLRRVNLRNLPADLSFERRVVFTPTFVLMGDGVEVGRMEGYAGEDFFWGLLGRMLSQADATWATQDGDR
jgi:hypothetical protein